MTDTTGVYTLNFDAVEDGPTGRRWPAQCRRTPPKSHRLLADRVHRRRRQAQQPAAASHSPLKRAVWQVVSTTPTTTDAPACTLVCAASRARHRPASGTLRMILTQPHNAQTLRFLYTQVATDAAPPIRCAQFPQNAILTLHEEKRG